jgi:hypothetical protein
MAENKKLKAAKWRVPAGASWERKNKLSPRFPPLTGRDVLLTLHRMGGPEDDVRHAIIGVVTFLAFGTVYIEVGGGWSPASFEASLVIAPLLLAFVVYKFRKSWRRARGSSEDPWFKDPPLM